MPNLKTAKKELRKNVKRHAANIYQKLQVDGRRAAVVEATRLGLL